MGKPSMALKFAFVIILILLAKSNSVLSLTTVHVSPTASTEEIKQTVDSIGQYMTFANYMQNESNTAIFNTSNTTTKFLPGRHDIIGIPVNQLVIEKVHEQHHLARMDC